MKASFPFSASTLALILVFHAGRLFAGSNPGPDTGPEPEPAGNLGGTHFLQLELSWDFGDLGTDWRKELVEDDPTATFLLRWKHSGPAYDGAKLSVYDASDNLAGEIPLTVNPSAGGNWQQTSFTIGALPTAPTLTMRLRLINPSGNQQGSASPEVQISAPAPDDPFLYTPLFVSGLTLDMGVPGIAGGVSCGGKFAADERHFRSGVRKYDGGAGPVGSNDRWHWGSITKSMTCTLLAILMEEGVELPGGNLPVSWDSPLSTVWPEWASGMHSRFSQTTLRHLGSHRSGIFLNSSEWDSAETPESVDDPVSMRSQIALSVTGRQQLDPDTGNPTPVGVDFTYRNENFFLLGAVMERLTGERYEVLMERKLFTPLGITTQGWGVPPEFGYYQPHGHFREKDFPHGIVVLNKELFPPQAPAGALYTTVGDMLKYLRLHAFGCEGTLTLSGEALAELHTPYPQQFSDDAKYALGWGASLDGMNLGHNGSIGTYYARASVDRNNGIVCATAANIGGRPKATRTQQPAGVSAYGNGACNLLHKHLLDRANSLCLEIPIVGSLAAGTFGSLGLLDSAKVQEWTDPDTFSVIEDPLFGGIGSDFLPVSLYLTDVRWQRATARARRPQFTVIKRLGPDLIELRFRTERGAIYQLWSAPNLSPEGRRMVSEDEATGESLGYELTVPRLVPSQFYLVRDLMP